MNLCKNLFFILIVSLSGCKSTPYQLKSHFSEKLIPAAPDYARSESWAALPTKNDQADQIPLKSDLKDGQAEAKVDVFFLHPTIFTGKPSTEYEWNANVEDAKMNESVDNSTILNQATAFNGSGKIYAPRYRQAHYHAFVTNDKDDKVKSLDVAYSDVKRAFEYYLKNYNQGRPIIIASHSQGTVHATRLIKEFFDNKPLQQQFVLAYLTGIATQPTVFTNIKPCESPEQTGCFVSWNTYAKDYYPAWHSLGLSTAVSTNPLTWRLDSTYAPASLNKGGVGLKFTMYPNLVDAQNHQGMLWINKPNIKGSFLLKTKVWHRADINFFYNNIRENVALRIENFLNK
ncbi:MAG: DUF3089 domain-containing protein [Arcicella sp.]|jgi:hypothetical protein|nr:DUF3089 domain-containing protein [Arcicella sp.]